MIQFQILVSKIVLAKGYCIIATMLTYHIAIDYYTTLQAITVVNWESFMALVMKGNKMRIKY